MDAQIVDATAEPSLAACRANDEMGSELHLGHLDGRAPRGEFRRGTGEHSVHIEFRARRRSDDGNEVIGSIAIGEGRGERMGRDLRLFAPANHE